MKIGAGDPRLLSVFAEDDDMALFMGTAKGRAIRFALGDVRIMTGRSSRGVRGMKLETGDLVVSAFGVPSVVLTPEVADEAEKIFLGKVAKKSASDVAFSALDGLEVVQIARSGHAKRTPLAAYRQTRRDNRGLADRGPAKTIEDFVGYALVREDSALAVVKSEGVARLDVGDIKKGGKATTGGISAEGVKRILG